MSSKLNMLDKISDDEQLNRIEGKLDILLSVIVIQQKDAAAAAGVHSDTVRNKVLKGELEVLTADGSRLNFLQLKDVPNLKKRSKKRR